MQLSNGVEVLQWSPDNNDYKSLAAVSADSWKQGAFLYHDGTTLKAFTPADTTVGAPNHAKLIGIASNGKNVGETVAIVGLKAKILMPAVNVTGIGGSAIVLYNATSGKYSAQGETQYNTDNEPDITSNFMTFDALAVEADSRIPLNVDGWTQYKALN